jgi:hypothetical protein
VKLLTIGFLAFAAVVLSSQIACAATRGVGKDNVSLPRPLAVCVPLPPAADPDFLTNLTAFMNTFCYKTENWQHDAQVRTSDAVHPYVRLWYSPPLYIYGRLPRGKKVSGPVLTRIDCKHLSGVATKRRAQMGTPLTLSSTSGRPRGPLYRTGFECAGSIRQPIFRSFKQPRFPSRSGAIGFATGQHGPNHPCVLVGNRDRCTVITAPLAKLVDPKTS